MPSRDAWCTPLSAVPDPLNAMQFSARWVRLWRARIETQANRRGPVLREQGLEPYPNRLPSLAVADTLGRREPNPQMVGRHLLHLELVDAASVLDRAFDGEGNQGDARARFIF